MWSSLPRPLYKNLIGAPYDQYHDLPLELGSGTFISVGEGGESGIISVYNRYNGKYSYLFLVGKKGMNVKEEVGGLVILDIVPLLWETFQKGTSLWLKECYCVDTTRTCDDVVAVYVHTEEMANREILVTPEKAWRPDYTKGRLVETPLA